MVEGESGLLACCPPPPPAVRTLAAPAGVAQWRCGDALFRRRADSLRGPQHSHAWCDEIAKWDNSGARAELAWDNMLMGLRLGDGPQAMATTTPRGRCRC
jgi:phage terminase large subunit-like protein